MKTPRRELVRFLFLSLVFLLPLHLSAKTLAIPDPVTSDSGFAAYVPAIPGMLGNEIFRRTHISILDRGELLTRMKSLPAEEVGCLSDSCLARTGRALKVDLVTGMRLSRVGDLTVLEVKLYDVTGNHLLAMENVRTTDPIETILTDRLDDLADSLCVDAGWARPRSGPFSYDRRTAEERALSYDGADSVNLGFQVRLGYSYNGYTMGKLNGTFSDLRASGYNIEDIRSGYGLSFGFLVQPSARFRIGLTFSQLQAKTGHEQDGIIFRYDVSANVLELAPAIRMTPDAGPDLWIGMGLGAYFCGGLAYLDAPPLFPDLNQELEASTFGVRPFVEFRFPLIPSHLWIAFNAGYRFASANDVKAGGEDLKDATYDWSGASIQAGVVFGKDYRDD